MKILYDHQIFSYQKLGGISRYFFELLKGFDYNKEFSFEVGLKCTNNTYFKDFINTKESPYSIKKTIDDLFWGINFKGKNRLYNLYHRKIINNNQNYSSELIQKGEFDIFHPTYYDTYFLDCIGNKPFALTVYDLTHEIYPELFPSGDMTATNKSILIDKASKIFAISEQTKSDLIKFYNVEDEKIKVIYLGNSLNTDKQKKITLPRNYLLYVGTRKHYKNFTFFIKSALSILHKNKEINILCVGAEFSKHELDFFTKNNINNQIHQVEPSDCELAYIYSKAIAFIFPSLYEGFGIPILEAFSCACPVLLSDIPVFHEIAEDAARYFDPTDISSLSSAINEIV